MNDPNGLVYFKGYYHVFYQYEGSHEVPRLSPITWGHARTKDFLNWEEMPVALNCDTSYDKDGCYSGTAIVKDDILYLFYASICFDENSLIGKYKSQRISVAYSSDGVNFKKYEGNPIISEVPKDGRIQDFRDPAIIKINNKYYLFIASANQDQTEGRLLAYSSNDLFNFDYIGIFARWENTIYCECPSLVPNTDNNFILACSQMSRTSGNNSELIPSFSLSKFEFYNNKFKELVRGNFQEGPDVYAGQIFQDHKGRNIMISWIPGWSYIGFSKKSLGCLSLPLEIKEENNKFYGYPIKEVQHLLKDSDEAIEISDDGFIVHRKKRDDVIYKGKINDIKVLKDNYILEIFLNKGEKVFAIVLC